MSALPITTDHGVLNRDEWNGWHRERLAKRAQTFHNEPSVLISEYNGEVQAKTSYHGRELLEMLQNADDAGEGDCQSTVLIRITEDGLCVANHGKVFMPGGIESLMISRNSTKQLDRTRYIGYRGLGFRSVLNWTESPFILSGELMLGFSRHQAEQWLTELCREDHLLRHKVESYRTNTAPWPVPILSVPALLCADDPLDADQRWTKSFRSTWTEAQSLRDAGYDTVIGIPFSEPEALADVLAQLDAVGPEVLLFTKHLSRLHIEAPERCETWEAVRQGNEVTVSKSGSQDVSRHWTMFEEIGQVPPELLKREQEHTPGYEIRLAVPDDRLCLSTDEVAGFCLYNYFPTLASFPFPMIAHATFELTDDRQHLVRHPANEFIASRLAEVMADAAESLRTASDPWKPLSIVTSLGELDTRLNKELGFGAALISSVRKRRLVPTRDNTWRVPDDARKLANTTYELQPDDAERWLPNVGFEDLVRDVPDPFLCKTLNVIEVPCLGEDRLRSRLNDIAPALTMDERAELVANLILWDLLPTDPVPSLLVNTEDRPIPLGETVFLAPAGVKDLALPPWMPLHLLHPDLTSALQRTFGNINVRYLIHKMADFGLREYVFVGLVSAINARASDHSRLDPVHERDYRVSALRWMCQLFTDNGGERGIGQRTEDLHVIVETRAGTFARADKLLFGREWDQGEIIEELLGQAAPDQLVASPRALGMEGDAAGAQAFLHWLGVSHQLSTDLVHGSNAFHQSVFEALRYPVRCQDYVIRSQNGWAENRYEFANVETILNFGKILANADPHAILAWVARDGRFNKWRSGDPTALLKITPARQKVARVMQDQGIPSYILWQLRTTCWLPGPDGLLREPTSYTLAGGATKEMQSFLVQPAVNREHPLFLSLGITRTEVNLALEVVGCVPALNDLSWDQIYDILLNMPSKTPDGRGAQVLYRTLMEKEEDPGDGPNRTRFLREGNLWGTKGDAKGYYPINELRYIDAAAVPPAIGRAVPLLVLEKRRGSQKVFSRLGVQALTTFNVVMEYIEEHPHDKDFSLDLDRLKPYVYALRLSVEARDTSRTPLRSCEIRLCKSARATASVAGHLVPVVLERVGEAVRDKHITYVVADASLSERPMNDPDIALTVGDVLADALDVKQASDFALLATALSHKRRLSLLARLLDRSTDAADDLLRQARERLAMDLIDRDDSVEQRTPYLPPPGPKPPTGDSIEVPHTPPVPPGLNCASGDLVVMPAEPPATKRSRQIALRIQATPAARTGTTVLGAKVDPALCQELIMLFEAAEGQGRYPLMVAHITGSTAYGCDVISFRTGTDRELFEREALSGRTRLELIERFIEVKGSSNKRGEVTLSANESKAAASYSERYYVYRVSPTGDGRSYVIAALDNPMNAEYRLVYMIDPVRSERVKCWVVTEQTEAENGEGIEDEK